MWRGNTKKLVTHAILSLYGIHLLTCNCIIFIPDDAESSAAECYSDKNKVKELLKIFVKRFLGSYLVG